MDRFGHGLRRPESSSTSLLAVPRRPPRPLPAAGTPARALRLAQAAERPRPAPAGGRPGEVAYALTGSLNGAMGSNAAGSCRLLTGARHVSAPASPRGGGSVRATATGMSSHSLQWTGRMCEHMGPAGLTLRVGGGPDPWRTSCPRHPAETESPGRASTTRSRGLPGTKNSLAPGLPAGRPFPWTSSFRHRPVAYDLAAGFPRSLVVGL